MWRQLVVCASAAVAFGHGCVGGTCTLIGCDSAEELRVELPLSAEEIEAATVTACRNDACWTGAFSELPDDWPRYAQAGIPLSVASGEPGPGLTPATLIQRSNGGSFALVFEVLFADYRDVRRGDTLRVEFEHGSGVITAEATVTSTNDDYPNGSDCDETPCRSARLEASP